ncbi:unnamed protein product [Nesidiocoris tenuis]|uniref:Uncharacterized protein n=1 Tax=Nesidiocoris tenuis TaxID=355587 RepID=A0A6H5HDG2_9HEMI|nr:unnamed protein product [Nesidiocoris tenuis]
MLSMDWNRAGLKRFYHRAFSILNAIFRANQCHQCLQCHTILLITIYRAQNTIQFKQQQLGQHILNRSPYPSFGKIAIILSHLKCLWARMRPMRAMLAEMPREPRVKMTRASVSPPGWHWKTREPFRVKFPAAPLPYRRFAPIIATAEPGKIQSHHERS